MLHNKPFITVIGVGLLLSLCGQLLAVTQNNIHWQKLTFLGLMVFETIGFFILLMNGTLIKSKYFRYVKVSIGILLLGALVRVLHLPDATYLAACSYLGFVVIYICSFINKPFRKRSDYLKLLWVFATFVEGILNFLHLGPYDFMVLSPAIMFLAIVDFVWFTKVS
ncbi:hypothetical protein [Fulvivirga sediminis]|uniref:Uncharacterized protein n=1 Tax=Fulvivirga sediminis TaxID=2803949 RepID=A0A937K0F9_9BACT|nr:hypothetical protein [Fulvivirga sediminis]MBL3657609.1 hypothetical protein [Fulvivirga sediminis]